MLLRTLLWWSTYRAISPRWLFFSSSFSPLCQSLQLPVWPHLPRLYGSYLRSLIDWRISVGFGPVSWVAVLNHCCVPHERLRLWHRVASYRLLASLGHEGKLSVFGVCSQRRSLWATSISLGAILHASTALSFPGSRHFLNNSVTYILPFWWFRLCLTPNLLVAVPWWLVVLDALEERTPRPQGYKSKSWGRQYEGVWFLPWAGRCHPPVENLQIPLRGCGELKHLGNAGA